MLWLLLSLILTVALAYHRSGLKTALTAYAALLLAYGVFGHSPGLFGLWLLVYVGVAVPLSVSALREEWLTRPALDAVQRYLLPARPGLRDLQPPSSEPTPEQRLFGDAEVLRHPASAEPPASAEADDDGWAAAVQNLAPRLAAQPDALSPAALAALRQSGLFGLDLPLEFDGLNLHPAERNHVLQAIAALDGGGPAVALLAVTGAATSAVRAHGNDFQQRLFLPRFGSGEKLGTLAHRSPWADDERQSPDRALVRRGLWKGRENLGLELRFEKSAVPMADEFLLSLPLHDPENLLGAESAAGARSAAILVPRDIEGLELLAPSTDDLLLPLVGLRANAVFVPMERLLGTSADAGDGRAQLDTGLIALCRAHAAIASGEAMRALRRAATQSRILAHHRIPTPRPAARDRALSDAALDNYGLDLVQRLLAGSAGELSPALAALAAFLADRLHESVMHQLAPLSPRRGPGDGSRSLSPLLPKPRLEPLLLASFPALQALLSAAGAQPYGLALARFDAALWPLLGALAHHQARSLLLALTNGRLARVPETGMQRHWQRLARYRAALACAADAWILGRNRGPADGAAEASLMEALAATLGLAAALYDASGQSTGRDELPLLDAWCERSCRRIEAGLDDFIFQQPTKRHMAKLRLLLLPAGRLTPMHSDAEAARIVHWLQTPGPMRQRLFCALPNATAPGTVDNLLDRIDIALEAAAPAQRKLRKAIDEGRIEPAFPLDQIAQASKLGIIDGVEVDRLRSAYNLCEDWQHWRDGGVSSGS